MKSDKKYMSKKISKNWPLLVLVLFSLTPLIWFLGRGGVLINGSDTNFPLDPIVWFSRRFFVWNAVASGGANFASSTAGLFFHLIQVIPFSLEISLQATQIVNLVFWFSLVVFSAFFFARAIVPQSKSAQLVFVTLYSYNVYLFNTWENIKVANLSVAVALPLFLAMLIWHKSKKISSAKLMLLTAVVGVITSGAGINPAYFLVIIGGLIIFALTQGGIKTLMRMLIVLFLVNSFWIVSTGNQLLFSQSRITQLSDIGFTNWLDSLSENTSLINIFRLQGAWDWYATDDAGAALYIPYANNFFHRLPFVVFSISLVALALGGFLIKSVKKDHLKVYFGLLLVGGLFLGAGSHPPTGTLYKFLTNHLPFFSFFRSPWYIFTPYVTLSLAGMTALLFASKNKILPYLASILIIGNLIYTYPLITGKIFRPGRNDSFFVKFPTYVFEAKNWLEKQSVEGRIASYPGDEIERFEWGYNGIESILNLFSSQETVFSNLNVVDAPISKLTQVFYSTLRRGQVGIAESLAAKLNIAKIFAKNDQSTLWGSLPSAVQNYNHAAFGPWIFYDLPANKTLPKIFSPQKVYFGEPREKLEEVIGFLTARDVLVDPRDTIVKQIPDVGEFTGEVILARNSQTDDHETYLKTASRQKQAFDERDLSKIVYTLNITEDGTYQPVIEDFLLDSFGISTEDGLEVTIDGEQKVWHGQGANGLLVFEPLEFIIGTHKIVIDLNNTNLLPDNQGILSLINREEKEKYLSFRIDPFQSLYPYLIEFDYRNIYGTQPVLKIEQKSQTTNFKFQMEAPPFSPEWTRFSLYFDPVPVKSSFLDLKPSAYPRDNPLGTKLEYAKLAVYRVFINKMVFIKDPKVNLVIPEKITFEKISSVKYQGEVKNSQGSHIIIFSENYSPDWKITLKNVDGTPITYDPSHFSSNLYANSWFIDDIKGDYKFEIYYEPQSLHNVFLAISIATLAGAAGYYLWEKVKR